MFLAWYIYYPTQLLNWCIEHPRLMKALAYVTFIGLVFLAWWVPAHAATPVQINAAITKVKEKTAEVASILGDPKDGTLYRVSVRDLPFAACGEGVTVGVSTISIMPMDSRGQTNDLTSIDVMTPYKAPNGHILLLDLNADGKVDSIAPMGAVTDTIQADFDKIIACIATTK